MEIVRTQEEYVVELFLKSAGKSLLTFRYFQTRPTSVISGHLVTLVGVEGADVIAYGHLDPEGGKTWLGVCVSEEWRGKGKGREIVSSLLEFGDRGGIVISLAVDNDNIPAVKLYEAIGFELTCKKTSTSFYQRAPKNGESTWPIH